MIQRSVSTWLRGMSRMKFSTYSSAGEPTSSSGVPSWTIAPSRMIAIRSPSRSASGRSCVMKSIVLPVSCLEPADLVLHVAADQRVERAERLVVEHHRRVDRERARDADPLLHAARELVGELVRRVLEADELQDLARPREPLGLRHAAHLEPERDVVDHAPVGEQAEVLEHHRDVVPPQLAQLGLAGRHDVAAGDLDRAGGRLDQADQRPHERRLARARRGP